MLKSAVIGCGAVSKNHGKALLGNAYTTLEYCVDIDYEKALAFSKTLETTILILSVLLKSSPTPFLILP